MISVLHYADDEAVVQLDCRVTRADSPQEFAYVLLHLRSKFDNVWPNQINHLFPQFENSAGNFGWASSEEEARQMMIKSVVTAFDEFNTWPQYTDHGYVPGETYEGDEQPTPPGLDPASA